MASDEHGRVGAGADEERVPEAHLPGEAGEEVEADRADRRDPGVVEDGEPEVAGLAEERVVLEDDGQGDRDDDQPGYRQTGLTRSQEAQVVLVVERHVEVLETRHQTLRTSLVPNSP